MPSPDEWARMTRTQALIASGVPERVAKDIVKAESQYRQTRQLAKHKKRSERTSLRLSREFGLDVSPEPPSEGRQWGLWDVFDLFYLLEYPIFNAVKHIADGDDFGDVLGAFARGLALQEKTSGDELLTSLGMQDGAGRSVMGFLLEIAANPINYVSGPLAMTKIGQLAKMKHAGRLKGLTIGSKWGKRIAKQFPKAKSLKEATAMIPKLGATWGEQAASKLPQRALVQVMGHPIVRGQKVVDALGQAGRAIYTSNAVMSARAFWGHMGNETMRRIVQFSNHQWKFQSDEALRVGGELDHWLKKVPDGIREQLVKLIDDPAFAIQNAITEGGKNPYGAYTYIRTIRKLIGKYTSMGKLDTDVSKNILGLLRQGYTEKDALGVLDTITSAMGGMSKKFHGKNAWLRRLFKVHREDVLFNPNFLDEYFGVIKPNETMRKEIAFLLDITNKGQLYDEGIETFIGRMAGAYNEGLPVQTRALFEQIVGRAWKFDNIAGPLGSIINSSVKPGTNMLIQRHSEVFAMGLNMFARDPANVLAQSPELFFFFQSMFRFGGQKGLPKTFRLTGRMIRKANNIYKAQRAVHILNRITSMPSQFASPEAKEFTALLKQHMTDLWKTGPQVARRKGAFAQLYSMFMGHTDKLPKRLDMKSVLGQYQKDLERLSSVLIRGDEEAIIQLMSRGVLDKQLAGMLRGLKGVDRYLIDGHIKAGLGDLMSVIGSKDPIGVTTRSLVKAKSFENALAVFMLEHMHIDELAIGKAGPKFVPGGESVFSMIEKLRSVPGVKIDEDAFKWARFLKTEFDKFASLEESMGLLRTQLGHYFPRFLTDKARKAMGKDINVIGGSRLRPGGMPFMKHRTLKNMTISEVNEYLAQGGLEKLFVDDPALAFAMRSSQHYKAVSYEQMVRKLGEVGEKVQKGTRLLGNDAKQFGLVVGSKGTTYKVPKDVAAYVNGFYNMVTNQDEIAGVQRMWGELISWWKGWTLGIFPAYHARNAVSNVTQCWIAGLKDPAWFVKAFHLQKNGGAMPGEMLSTATGKLIALDDIFAAGMKYGIPGTGLFTAELPAMAKKGVKYYGKYGRAPKGAIEIAKATLAATGKGKLGKVGQYVPYVGRESNKLLSMGFLVGRGIENNARWALFMNRVAEGYTYQEAAETVFKYLFDYSDINHVVGKLKDLFPFITWSRKNLPLQVENLVMRPATVAPLVKGAQLVTNVMGATGMDTPDLPQFIRENVPMALTKEEDGTYRFFLFGNWLAATDVERLFDPLDMVVNMMFPGVRLIPELLTNHSFFFKTPIERGIPGEKKKFLGIDMHPKWAHVLRSMRGLNEFSRLFGLGDEQKEGVFDRIMRATMGWKTFVVDPEQEMLRRYSKHNERMGRALSYERYKKLR